LLPLKILQAINATKMSKKRRQDVLALSIEKYAAEGKSIGKVDNKVIFVEGAVPGDVVDVYLKKSKKDWAEGGIKNLVQASPNRIDAACMHFGTCGGCKWQMLPYNLQLQYKEQQVIDTLQRIGQVKEAEFLPIQGCEQQYYYRNKLEYTFSNKRYLSKAELNNESISGEQNVLGYHAPGLFDKVIDINHCHLMQEPQNSFKNSLRDFALANNLTFYDIKNHTGLLRNVMIRITKDGTTMVNIIFGENDVDGIQKVLQFVDSKFPNIQAVHYTINTKMNDSIYDQDVITHRGDGYIIESLEEFKFKISPKSFFQTNSKQAEELYKITRTMAGFTGTEVLYDLYCGTGSIGIFCSKQVSKIIGVESVADAIVDAKANAALNQVNNSHWYAGDVIKICDDAFFEKHGKPDVIITDPPRAGMHAQLIEMLLKIKAPKIVYVSCNPATQARDLALLQQTYKVVKVQAVDMFPHTHHIESVALLMLKD
jgi:23S rRNA (uracil1939-C5)-methyltransferase